MRPLKDECAKCNNTGLVTSQEFLNALRWDLPTANVRMKVSCPEKCANSDDGIASRRLSVSQDVVDLVDFAELDAFTEALNEVSPKGDEEWEALTEIRKAVRSEKVRRAVLKRDASFSSMAPMFARLGVAVALEALRVEAARAA